jgi:predicted nucleic acid-binding protein
MVHRNWCALVTGAMKGLSESQLLRDRVDLSQPFHFLSHEELLCFPPHQPEAPTASQAIDAIIVPTIRDADQLRSAADLAVQLRCLLIAVYSQRSADELSCIQNNFDRSNVVIVGLPDHLPPNLLGLLAFGTSAHPAAVSHCARDISMKRNLGLALAKMCQWTRILFLDDDISLSPEKVRSAARLLADYPVVGFQVKNFPDNSVMGHAKRLTGWEQDVFISGGSLLVDPQRLNGFFPSIYHEDWFCVLNHVCAGTVAIGGEVEQLPYSPFASPMRAVLEEFGDILGEGLLWLIHHKRDLSFPDASFWVEALDASFWHSALQRRRTLLAEITRRLLERPWNNDITSALISVLEARVRRFAAEDFVSFVQQWLHDLAQWRARLAELPTAVSVAKALAELGLPHSTIPDHDAPPERLAMVTADPDCHKEPMALPAETRRWPLTLSRQKRRWSQLALAPWCRASELKPGTARSPGGGGADRPHHQRQRLPAHGAPGLVHRPVHGGLAAPVRRLRRGHDPGFHPVRPLEGRVVGGLTAGSVK